MSAASPYTSHELLEAMAGIDLAGAEVTVVHYGERNEALADALRQRGGPERAMRCTNGGCPTTSVRCRTLAARHREARSRRRHLYESSAVEASASRGVDLGLADDVIQALNSDVVVASVGPICSAALTDAGVHPQRGA